jgi:hypothetical protein
MLCKVGMVFLVINFNDYGVICTVSLIIYARCNFRDGCTVLHPGHIYCRRFSFSDVVLLMVREIQFQWCCYTPGHLSEIFFNSVMDVPCYTHYHVWGIQFQWWYYAPGNAFNFSAVCTVLYHWSYMGYSISVMDVWCYTTDNMVDSILVMVLVCPCSYIGDFISVMDVRCYTPGHIWEIQFQWWMYGVIPLVIYGRFSDGCTVLYPWSYMGDSISVMDVRCYTPGHIWKIQFQWWMYGVIPLVIYGRFNFSDGCTVLYPWSYMGHSISVVDVRCYTPGHIWYIQFQW